MGHNGWSRSLKKEDVQVPDTPTIEEFSEPHYRLPAKEEEDIMDESEGILDNTEHGENLGQLSWDIMDWDGLSITKEGDANGHQKFENYTYSRSREDYNNSHFSPKQEEYSFLEDDEKKLSLNLSLNYQEVLEAWSDRTPWADDSSSHSANDAYTGEVPVMEEERRRREASVIRYRKKRQSRLFSKKIRYQVRKLNADKRPRLKGRFVKRVPAEMIHK